MDYIKILDEFDAGVEQARKSEEESTKRRRKVITDHIKLIQDLPDLSGLAVVQLHPAWFGSALTIFINPNSGHTEAVRSLVQGAFNVIANRKFNTYNGDISYIFTPDQDTTVEITGGRSAPGCVIEPEEIKITRYKMTCPDLVTSL